jgi:hypothetical protein
VAGYTFTYYDATGLAFPLNDNVDVWLKLGGMYGFGVLRPELATMRTPYTHGVAEIGAPVTLAREMSLALQVQKSTFSEWAAYLRTLRRDLNTLKGVAGTGRLECVTPDGVTRYIDCRMVECGEPEMEGPVFGTALFTFWAALPWFYDTASQQIALWTYLTTRRALPMTLPNTLVPPARTGVTLPMTLPSMLSTKLVRFSIPVDNAGDVETWPVFTIVGPAKWPKLYNATTGQRLQMTQDNEPIVTSGGSIVVDMGDGTILRTEGGVTQSIVNSVDRGGVFWPLRQGVNTIAGEVWLDAGGSVRVSYPQYYVCL